jgi:hypothetical protein
MTRRLDNFYSSDDFTFAYDPSDRSLAGKSISLSDLFAERANAILREWVQQNKTWEGRVGRQCILLEIEEVGK